MSQGSGSRGVRNPAGSLGGTFKRGSPCRAEILRTPRPPTRCGPRATPVAGPPPWRTPSRPGRSRSGSGPTTVPPSNRARRAARLHVERWTHDLDQPSDGLLPGEAAWVGRPGHERLGGGTDLQQVGVGALRLGRSSRRRSTEPSHPAREAGGLLHRPSRCFAYGQTLGHASNGRTGHTVAAQAGHLPNIRTSQR